MIDYIVRFLDGNIYLFLLVIPFLGQLGIPGSMFFVLYAGSQANNYNDLFVFFIIVLISEIAGDLLSYGVGRLFWETALVKRILHYKRIKKVFDKSKLFMEDKGGVSIFLSRFLVTGIGASVNYISGLELYSLKKFAFLVVTGEILYSIELLFLGYFFKETFEEIANLFTNFSTLIILGFVLYIIWKNAFRMSPSGNA
ncbi:MAG: VTT domain-containing protein [Candidatus Gracilibacteria bacterium]